MPWARQPGLRSGPRRPVAAHPVRLPQAPLRRAADAALRLLHQAGDGRPRVRVPLAAHGQPQPVPRGREAHRPRRHPLLRLRQRDAGRGASGLLRREADAARAPAFLSPRARPRRRLGRPRREVRGHTQLPDAPGRAAAVRGGALRPGGRPARVRRRPAPLRVGAQPGEPAVAEGSVIPASGARTRPSARSTPRARPTSPPTSRSSPFSP
jgi:hypothetical protein